MGAKQSKHATAAAVLRYWHAVEMFSPQALPKVAPNDKKEPVFALAASQPLAPWEEGHPLRKRFPPKNRSRRFTIYCGGFNVSLVKEALEKAFGNDPESFDQRLDGQTCLFAFSVADNGRPLFDTFVLSSCAWAFSRTREKTIGPDWLVGFAEHEKKICDHLKTAFALTDDDTAGQPFAKFNMGRVIGFPAILDFTNRVAAEFGLQDVIGTPDIRASARLVASKRKYTSEDQDFLNSFILEDLGRAEVAASANKMGQALTRYLEEAPAIDERIDVRRSRHTLFETLNPESYPRGRWPSAGHHPLVFSQQFAINAIRDQVGDGCGIFAVNGPPGTGKTTLLRDLIADVVVQRAERLAKLPSPDKAFSGVVNWKSDKFTRAVSIWKPEFRGFEIVVASSNNGAVENISFEIPGQEAVDASWLANFDYFREASSRVLDRPAWALMAARLGNKSNRSNFVNRFWYGEKTDQESEADPESESGGLLAWFKAQEAKGTPADWKAAVKRFRQVAAVEDKLRKERAGYYRSYANWLAVLQDIPLLEKRLAALDDLIAEATARVAQMRTLVGRAEVLVEAARDARDQHRDNKPGLWNVLVTLGRSLRAWNAADRQLLRAVNEADRGRRSAVLDLERPQADQQRLAAELVILKAQLDGKREAGQRERAAIQAAAAALGAAFPRLNQWKEDEAARELSAPWLDAEWNRARAQVFLAALDLHKAFLLADPSTMRKNLQGAMDVVGGTVPATVSAEAIESAWTSVFFMVPVVSTTFASFGRLFPQLSRDSLGWVLIDEAGQATPQVAAGAIWRARRAVIVGDPLQLEPVLTLPFTAQQALRKHFGVSETWLPGGTSTQQLADRISRFGTFVQSDDDPIWVGSPLRVHRRCDNPMFEISNRVAYDGLMVFGTPARAEMDLIPSQWIDVVAEEADGHWIEEEGVAVRDLLAELTHQGVKPSDIFLISPFRAVKRELENIASGYSGMNSGTVHTVQGKEADVVILVLGGNPRKPGAKKWASERPNLLNVAASRARRRLYVVGDKAEWRKYRYFSTCAALLDNNVIGSGTASLETP